MIYTRTSVSVEVHVGHVTWLRMYTDGSAIHAGMMSLPLMVASFRYRLQHPINPTVMNADQSSSGTTVHTKQLPTVYTHLV